MIAEFYDAFQRLDADAMASAYADAARFTDPVFTLNNKAEISAMWAMLCTSIKTDGADIWRLDYTVISETATEATARWTAHYRFSATGRLVENHIESRFTLADGLIVVQDDRFDFWRWSRQALGAPGWLLGWSGGLQDKVRAKAADRLKRFMA